MVCSPRRCAFALLHSTEGHAIGRAAVEYLFFGLNTWTRTATHHWMDNARAMFELIIQLVVSLWATYKAYGFLFGSIVSYNAGLWEGFQGIYLAARHLIVWRCEGEIISFDELCSSEWLVSNLWELLRNCISNTAPESCLSVLGTASAMVDASLVYIVFSVFSLLSVATVVLTECLLMTLIHLAFSCAKDPAATREYVRVSLMELKAEFVESREKKQAFKFI